MKRYAQGSITAARTNLTATADWVLDLIVSAHAWTDGAAAFVIHREATAEHGGAQAYDGGVHAGKSQIEVPKSYFLCGLGHHEEQREAKLGVGLYRSSRSRRHPPTAGCSPELSAELR